MRTLKAVVAFALVTATMLTCAWAAEHTKDSLDVVKKNVKEKKAVLVDVREESEWKAGHVEKAVFLPLSGLRGDLGPEEIAKRLPKDKIIYTHCAVGKRALTAGDILAKHGYKVRPLKPGYKDLLKAGFKKADD